MRTVALFGGSFNPPHVAHQLVALLVLETQPVDELWFVPTWKHALGKELTSFDDRVAMTELAAVALGPRARVSRIEDAIAKRAGAAFVASRTLETVLALEAEHPDARFRIVVGADILLETDKWWRWDELAKRAPPIVVGRPGFPTPPGAIPAIVGVSSTEIRAALARGDEPMGLLPRAVMRYISDEGLYR